MEPHNEMSIDGIHQKIISIKAELESFRQHPTLGAWVSGLEAMLQQLQELFGMMGEQAEIHLSQWVGIFPTYIQGIIDESPELAKSLEELSTYIDKGINAGLWRVAAELPLWAQDLDPAQGHSLDGFKKFLILIEALKETEIPGIDYEMKAALEQRRKTLREWAQRWIVEGVGLEGIEDYKKAFDFPDEPTAKRWQALESFVADWAFRVHEGLPGDELETTIMLRHRLRDDIRNLCALIMLRHRTRDDIKNLGANPLCQRHPDTFGVIKQLLDDYLKAMPPGQSYHDTFDVIRRLLDDYLKAMPPGQGYHDPLYFIRQLFDGCLNFIPPGQGYHDTFDVIRRLLVDDLNAIARLSWVPKREIPKPSLEVGETAAQIANRELNLRFFNDLPLFIEYIEMLWSALEGGESPAEGIYEASIICKDLFCRSGNRVLDVLDRKLTLMVYRVSERGEVPEHELKLMKLDEIFAQGLAVYKYLDAEAFVSSLYQIVGLDAPKNPHPPDNVVRPSEELPASIGSPQDAEACLSHAVYQTAVLLKQQPMKEGLSELYRNLLKIDQSFRDGRVLSKEQRIEIADNLSMAVSRLPENLTRLLVDLGNYVKGKKIASRSVFANVLDRTVKDARSKFSHPYAGPVWAAVLRQLRAVQRWTVGKRVPSTVEREMTHNILQESAAALEDKKTEKDFVRRLRELDVAFQQWEELEADRELKLDIEPITSNEQLLEGLQEMEEICQELAYRPGFTDPTAEQEPIIEIISKLSKMKGLSLKEHKSTTRERAQVMGMTADADKVSPDLCPTIPDFRKTFIADILRLANGFGQLMKTSEFAASEIRPLKRKGTFNHVISPKNWILMGFVQSEGKTPGLYRCSYEGVDAGLENADEMDIALTRFHPNREKLACLVLSEGKRFTDLSWDPYGYMLGFRHPDESIVGWVLAGNVKMPIERFEATGSNYIWTSKGDGFVVSDAKAGKLWRIDITTGESIALTNLDDDGNPEQPPRMAVPQQGGRLAFTSRSSASSIVELRVLTYRRRRPVVDLLKQVSDATATLLPFWIEPDQLGTMIISPKEESTSIISFNLKESDEEILYESKVLEPARTPCPSPFMRYLAFFRTSGLSLLDRDRGGVQMLVPAGWVDGELRFGKDRIFVEGGDAAYCIELKKFKDERVPLPNL
jgi:hypothetical protein